jgi:hypothetical protein
MDVLKVFRAKGKQLFWQRLEDTHVVGRPTGEPIEADAAYAVVRLAEMYLGTTRVLWRKRSPLLHAWVKSGTDEEQYTVAGPGQLQDLAERNLDRVLVLNYRLAGPIPYKGSDLSLLTGLYAVPREDGAAALVGTVGALAGLVSAGAATGTEIAKVVKSGVDSILGLGETRLLLGVDDTFSASNPLQSGFVVGIGAPATEVDFSQLWLDGGRLKVGATAGLAEPYQRHDYFVIGLERLERRADWSGLPGLHSYEAMFTGILASGKDKDGLLADLKVAWPTFREALVTSPHLTRHDAEEIAKDVGVDLLKRVEAIVSKNPFETRSFSDGSIEQLEPREVDFARVGVRDLADDPAAIAVLAGTS